MTWVVPDDNGGTTKLRTPLGTDGTSSMEVVGNIARAQVQVGPAGSFAYAAGQVVGGVIELAGAGRIANGHGMILSVSAALKAASTQQLDVIFFNSQPTGPYADGAAFALNAADVSKISKVYHVTDWTALGASYSFGQAPSEPRFYGCADTVKTTSLWAVIVARGAVTLSAATDLTLTARFSRN